jgi:rod shape-determining protein MreC
VQRKISIIIVAIVFGAILIFANAKGYLNSAKSTVGVVSSPIGNFFVSLGGNLSNTGSSFLNLGKLQEENSGLSSEVNRLKSELVLLREVESENESLRKELDFVSRGKFNYESAAVIGYDPSNLRGMITINKGRADGLKNGMAATNEGFLIGRVSELFEHTAKIQLVTDPTSAIPVTIQGTTINGIAKGELGSGLTMEKIPQGEDVKTGQSIMTSGLGGEIPRGIVIGEIEGVLSQENSLFVSAKIRVHSDINNVLRVLVIKS